MVALSVVDRESDTDRDSDVELVVESVDEAEGDQLREAVRDGDKLIDELVLLESVEVPDVLREREVDDVAVKDLVNETDLLHVALRDAVGDGDPEGDTDVDPLSVALNEREDEYDAEGLSDMEGDVDREREVDTERLVDRLRLDVVDCEREVEGVNVLDDD